MSLVTLKRRSAFLRVRGGARWSASSLLVEGKMRVEAGSRDAGLSTTRQPGHSDITSSLAATTDLGPPQFGFTVTKKLGGAVVRNRIRRRLREIIRQSAEAVGLPGCDYVIVARDGTLRRPHEQLRGELEKALAQVNRKLAASRR